MDNIQQVRNKINKLLNVFTWKNDYVKGWEDALYQLLDYVDEIERED